MTKKVVLINLFLLATIIFFYGCLVKIDLQKFDTLIISPLDIGISKSPENTPKIIILKNYQQLRESFQFTKIGKSCDPIYLMQIYSDKQQLKQYFIDGNYNLIDEDFNCLINDDFIKIFNKEFDKFQEINLYELRFKSRQNALEANSFLIKNKLGYPSKGIEDYLWTEYEFFYTVILKNEIEPISIELFKTKLELEENDNLLIKEFSSNIDSTFALIYSKNEKEFFSRNFSL